MSSGGISASNSRPAGGRTSRTSSETSIRTRFRVSRPSRDLGLRVGIVGNQTQALERWAREAALPAAVISSSATLGVRKPDPRFFERLVELAECAPEELAYVGDRVDNDVLPALAAGLVAVHVRRGPWGRLQTAPASALTIDSLDLLPDALASLS